MNISNAEKQARFRKKEDLSKFAQTTFREWQAMAIRSRANPRNVLALLNEAADLPYAWTDEDYARAEQRIAQLRMDLIGSRDEIKNDIDASRSAAEDFMTSPDPNKWLKDTKEAVINAHALASHLISAIELSKLGNAEKAAAIMEAVRHVGRGLANTPDVEKSPATTICLAALPGFYDRPDWFLKSLAKWLAEHLEEEDTRELGKRLIDYDHGDWP